MLSVSLPVGIFCSPIPMKQFIGLTLLSFLMVTSPMHWANREDLGAIAHHANVCSRFELLSHPLQGCVLPLHQQTKSRRWDSNPRIFIYGRKGATLEPMQSATLPLQHTMF